MDNKTVETGQNGRKRHNITLTPSVQEKGGEMAKHDLRSFSNFLEWLLDQEWQRRSEPKTDERQLTLMPDK